MRVIFFFLICLSSLAVYSQAPQKISYQAVIRENNNQLVVNVTVGMQISILQGSASGSVVYSETHTPVSNANGLVSLEIGMGAVVSGTFAAIDWANGPFFLKMETDPLGGTNYTLTGTTQLLSVPYALYAEKSGTPGPQGIQGPQGAQGVPGPQGIPGPSGSAGNFAHYVGELYGGGIIVGLWLDNGVEHGLIASLTDVGSSSNWSNVVSDPVGVAGQDPTDGMANTNAIIAQPGHVNSAAKICNDYVAGGFTDWYLPAMYEMIMMSNSFFIVNNILGNTNGFNGFEYYWSSTELATNPTSVLVLSFGNISSGVKDYPGRIRAVRKF